MRNIAAMLEPSRTGIRHESVSTCLMCGREGVVLHRGLHDTLFGVQGEWNVRTCPDAGCGTHWLDPRPVIEDIHLAYLQYYTHGQPDQAPGGAARSLADRTVSALKRLWLVLLGLRGPRKKIELMFLDDRPPGRVLEVGCGEGNLLVRLRERGWTAEGQEVDDAAAQRARERTGLTVHLGELTSLGLAARSYDAIVMTHVLEHVHDPVALLRECRRLLAPGGVVVAATPNPASFGHARFGSAWRGLEPPRHIHLFPPDPAARLAEQAGFETATAWTSVARASGILQSSRDQQLAQLAATGAGAGHRRNPVIRELSAMGDHLRSRLAFARDKQSGEETVLRAS